MNNNFIDKCQNYTKSLILEKLIIGVEEPIFINGVGKILAKVDSGNSAYNVIHGEDFYYQGNIVIFTTYDESGRPHKISKKVQDTITINIGAGHTEERPIILLDVKFADEEYMNVPFSVGNRSENKNKVLLGKEFLAKELDALIDVTKKKISSKGIDVDVDFKNKQNKKQLNEEASSDDTEENLSGENTKFPAGYKKNRSGATSDAGKIAKKILAGTKGAFNIAKAFTTTNTNLAQTWEKVKEAWKKAKEEAESYQKTDKYLIFKALNVNFMNRGNPIIPFIQNPQVFKVLDYFGTDYKNENNIKSNEKEWEKVKKEISESERPILYFVIYNGNDVDKAKQILNERYPMVKGDFYSMLKDIKKTFDSNNIEEVVSKFKDVLYKNDILYVFALCKGRGTSRQVSFLGQVIPKNEQVEFLSEKPARYKIELIRDIKKIKNIGNKFFDGTFNTNKFFGFLSWYDKNKERVSSLNPKEVFDAWLSDENIIRVDDENIDIDISNTYHTFIGDVRKPELSYGDKEKDNKQTEQGDNKQEEAGKQPIKNNEESGQINKLKQNGDKQEETSEQPIENNKQSEQSKQDNKSKSVTDLLREIHEKIPNSINSSSILSVPQFNQLLRLKNYVIPSENKNGKKIFWIYNPDNEKYTPCVFEKIQVEETNIDEDGNENTKAYVNKIKIIRVADDKDLKPITANISDSGDVSITFDTKDGHKESATFSPDSKDLIFNIASSEDDKQKGDSQQSKQASNKDDFSDVAIDNALSLMSSQGISSKDSKNLLKARDEAEDLKTADIGPKSKEARTKIQRIIHELKKGGSLSAAKLSNDKRKKRVNYIKDSQTEDKFESHFIIQSRSKNKNLYFIYDFENDKFLPINIIEKQNKNGNIIYDIKSDNRKISVPRLKSKDILKESCFIIDCLRYKKS